MPTRGNAAYQQWLQQQNQRNYADAFARNRDVFTGERGYNEGQRREMRKEEMENDDRNNAWKGMLLNGVMGLGGAALGGLTGGLGAGLGKAAAGAIGTATSAATSAGDGIGPGPIKGPDADLLGSYAGKSYAMDSLTEPGDLKMPPNVKGFQQNALTMDNVGGTSPTEAAAEMKKPINPTGYSGSTFTPSALESQELANLSVDAPPVARRDDTNDTQDDVDAWFDSLTPEEKRRVAGRQ